MGWGYGIVNGREIGYSVEATCDHPGCTKKIDRGVSYACGGMHGEDDPEGSCAGYFCQAHKSCWTSSEHGYEFCVACAADRAKSCRECGDTPDGHGPCESCGEDVCVVCDVGEDCCICKSCARQLATEEQAG